MWKNIFLLLVLFIFSCQNEGNKKNIKENMKITINPKNATYSGHELVIIPRDSKFIPTEKQIADCLNILKKEYPSLLIESEKLDAVEFLDCGQNFETVNCNKCGNEIDIESWQDQMSVAFEKTHFKDLSFITSCCKSKSSLNELIYHSDCGFASYCISINNAIPNLKKEERIAQEITEIFQVEIKVFWKHI